MNIRTVDELAAHSANELLQTSGIGRKTIQDIRRALDQHGGLRLRGDPANLAELPFWWGPR